MIIGFTGVKGSGKDTAGNYLVSEYGFQKISFADKLKESAAALFGIHKSLWDELKNDRTATITLSRDVAEKWFNDGCTGPSGEPYYWDHRDIACVSAREFLQLYGTESHRDVFGQNFWVHHALVDIDPNLDYVVTDVRFDNEAIAIVERGGFVFKVDRDTGATDTHVSEAGVSEAWIDEVIDNNSSLGELYEQLDSYFEDYRSDYV